MFDIYLATYLFATVLCLLLVLKFNQSLLFSMSKSPSYQLPKGPTAWPLVGNLFQIVKNPHLKFSQWAVKYGKLYTVYLGNKQALVINDPKLMKELFRHPAATGKFATDTMLLITQGPYGMLNTEGPAWIEQKQFFIKSVIEFGFGSSRLEPLILAEIDEVCEWIEKQCDDNRGCIIFNDMLKCATNNALWTIFSGERLRLDDRKIVNLLDHFLEGMQYTMKTGLGFFPWLKNIAPHLSGYVAFDKACKDIHEFIAGHFEAHKKSRIEGSPRDVIDAYIEHVDNTTRNEIKSSSFYGKVGQLNSISTFVESFTGGGDTSSATITWVMYYLSQHPQIQEKLWEEIDRVIGIERDPSFHDRARMPILEAVIHETFRYSSLLPLGIMHQLKKDIQFQQYHLPKGLILIPNMYYCHHSTEIWGDPQNFRPSRFLENATLYESMVPFQVGKRSCPGEPLVKDVLFLFIAKMFQKWEVSPHPNISKAEYFSPEVGVLMLPKRLEVVMSKRK